MRGAILSVCVLLALGAGATPAAAMDCKDPPDQMTMNLCAAGDAKAARDELDALYRGLLARLTEASDRDLLTKSQVDWETYSRSECAFETSGSTGGSIHRMTVSLCMEKVTRERIKTLTGLRDCADDDLGCWHALKD